MRNVNFTVITGDGSGYFLKGAVDQDTQRTLANEARVYAFLTSFESTHAFSVPMYAYDPDEHILILGVVRHATTLTQYYLRRKHFSITLARGLARALGRLHETPSPGLTALDINGQPESAPWILSIHRPSLDLLPRMTNFMLYLVETLQRFPEFAYSFDDLYQNWPAEVVIHGDIRGLNCLVFGHSANARMTKLRLVDWELAGMGDPCWDVGCVFADYLSSWVLLAGLSPHGRTNESIEPLGYPLERVQPAIRVFWDSYVRQRALHPTAAEGLLSRALLYASARLVQTALEKALTFSVERHREMTLLQLALNVIRQPRSARLQLLGIPC